MTGYSTAPLARKLGIRPGLRVYFAHPPTDVLSGLRTELTGCEVVRGPRGPLDFAMVFARSRSQLAREFGRVAESLAPAGMVWASWPKKASGRATALDERGVRAIGLATGLVDVKICAVSPIWSGLKFVRRRIDRGWSHGGLPAE